MWQEYRKKGIVEMVPCNARDVPAGAAISISQVNKDNGSPKDGDMIARDPNNPNDMWLVSKEYFEANYELIN